MLAAWMAFPIRYSTADAAFKCCRTLRVNCTNAGFAAGVAIGVPLAFGIASSRASGARPHPATLQRRIGPVSSVVAPPFMSSCKLPSALELALWLPPSKGVDRTCSSRLFGRVQDAAMRLQSRSDTAVRRWRGA